VAPTPERLGRRREAAEQPEEREGEHVEDGEHDRVAHDTSFRVPLMLPPSTGLRIDGTPVDHVKLPITDLAASRAFYSAAPAPFGWTLVYYYAAFVIDPDGHNIEAVYHGEGDRR
jgi:hypothetical protein